MTEFLTPVVVPDGAYAGVWGGYVLKFDLDGKPVQVQTKAGIRTPAAPVSFLIQDGRVDEATIKVERRSA